MCIIVVKHEGNTLAKETLEICFHNNNDGAGFMYLDEARNVVVGDKGYMTFASLWSGLKRKGWIDSEERVHADRGLVLHFRLGTHGSNTAPLTHPFPISSNETDLRMLNWESDWGVVHNGVISGMVDWNCKKNISDTMVFIKDYLADEKVLSMLDHGPCVRLLMMGLKSSNKFAFLTATGGLILLGNFLRGQDGNIYSNSSFQQKVQRYNSYNWRTGGNSVGCTYTPRNPCFYTTRLVASDGKVYAACEQEGPCGTCPWYTFYSKAQTASAKHWCGFYTKYLYALTSAA